MSGDSSDRDRNAEAIFETLLELPEADRADYLDTTCGGNPVLRRTVLARLEQAGAGRGGPALPETAIELPGQSRPAASPRPRPEPRALPVGSIGPYRLKKLLGEGGMGAVYLAEQSEPIQRQVAIKLIQSRLPSREAEYRFEVERKALARMNHPNIAQVFEASSTEDGQPYLVMEHVPGAPLTQYCDAHELSIGQRLDLFLDVCDGIHHAHQKGVLHRDIKPSNVLVAEVGGRPGPKIIDFGIAKALDESSPDDRLTRVGWVVGTPAYLSPEAVLTPEGADVDIRSDVYGLGVLLFELLVGEVPFARSSKSLETLVERVRSEPVPRPSRRFGSLDPTLAGARARARSSTANGLRRRLRGDLDWILLKALAKERDRRYASVAAFAADLRRHRRFEAIEARPPSTWYLTHRFVRRNKIQVAAGVFVTLALVAGLAARTQEARRANREAARANLEAAAAREVSDFLTTLFEVSDPSQARGSTVTARELLDRGAARVQDELEGQPLTRARLMQVMGGVYQGLGLYEGAAELLTGAARVLEDLGPGHQLQLASVREGLGTIYYSTGRYAEADELYRQVLDTRLGQLGATHADTATILARLGDLHEVQGQYAEAEPLLTRSLQIRNQVLEPDHPDRAENLERLGIVLARQDRREEGEAMLLESLDIRRRVLGNDHPKVALGLNNLAIVRAEGGDLEGGRELFEEALAIREAILAPDHPDLGQSLLNLGMLHRMLGELPAAEGLVARAEAVWAAKLGERHPRVIRARETLAGLAEDQGDLDRADALLSQILETLTREDGASSSDLAATLEGLARVRRSRGELSSAIELYRLCLEDREARLDPEDEAVVRVRNELRETLAEAGQDPAAARAASR